MERIDRTLKKWTTTTPNSPSDLPSIRPESENSAPPQRQVYRCNECKDMGWLYQTDHNGDVLWEPGAGGQRTAIVRCSCQLGKDQERRAAYLLRIDGLTPGERQVRFAELVRDYNPDAIARVENATTMRRGIITLTGKPGCGKSALLMCAVNGARDANVPAVYSTVTDILDYLRAAYAPGADVSFDSRWDLLVGCEVLALDELDEFNSTPWATERFLRLMDERWRNMDRRLTLCATNARVNSLPEKVSSRLRDGRAQVIEMQPRDMRRYQTWGDS